MCRKKIRFSLRQLMAFVTLCAVACAITRCFGSIRWLIVSLRIGIPILLLALIIRRLCTEGYKLDGALSFVFLLSFHYFAFCFLSETSHEISLIQPIFLCSLYVIWVAFALTAIRSRMSPNFQIGALSLVFILSPDSLQMLDLLHDVLAWHLDMDWRGYRIFRWLFEVLWWT